MFLARLKSAAVLTMVAALIIGAGLLTRRALADERRPDPPPARPAAPRVQPPAKPPEAPPAGRIVLHKDLELLSVKPDGSDSKGMARLAASDLLGYQPHSARLSPDGKRIAFGKAVLRVDDNGNQGAAPPDTLYLRDADKAAEGTALIHVDGVEMNNWAWSPDGARIALVTWDKEHSARNWIVDVKNKDIKELPLPKFRLKDKEYTMAIQDWSPDGKWFLAAGNGLHLVKADGTDPKRLTEAGNIFAGTVRFAPDGRRALFVTVEDEDKGYALRTVDFASRKVRTLAEGKNFAEIMACWSPDGRRVAYAVRYKDENNSGEQETTLFTVDADGANTVTVMTDKRRTGFVSFVLMAWR